MSEVSLGKVMMAKGFRVAALARSGAGAQMMGERIVGWGRKDPVAILIAGPDGIAAFAPDGGVLSRAEIEALAPDVWGQFAQSARGQDA
ncbi:hypothetical protein [Pararhodobacter zhoushanensis]|uniref:Uncharacterized protein n=1 Tax=Pararhodobacter zhoushanensis TaxID=2479545 RepID=A0ABT3H133_9RHOB|nr:hypothetical protein [Pararhodobacter zhoushanensis]MCW1933499.1 hypothetical protein [Pararhodobacter zhoushanensis]